MPRRRRYQDDREKPLLPPRRKDWKEGTYQIGVFVRTATGGKIEYVRDEAPKELAHALLDLVLPTTRNQRVDDQIIPLKESKEPSGG